MKDNGKMNLRKWTSIKKNISNVKGGVRMELTLNKQEYYSNFFSENNSKEKVYKNDLCNARKNITLNCIKYIEDDNSVTLSLEDFDIVVNEFSYDDAIASIIQDLKEYVSDYMDEPEYWSTDIKRKQQIEWLVKLFDMNNEDEIKDIITCRNGKN
jgi:hypothetical protein